MKGSLCQANPHSLFWSHASFIPNHNLPLMPCKLKVKRHSWSLVKEMRKEKEEMVVVVGCASWGMEAELERELEEEEEMGRFRHKCGERKDVVELLECLEREAIMGEDEGKEPVDYNRRAQIFDRSSRVFQAIRQLNSEVLSQHPSK